MNPQDFKITNGVVRDCKIQMDRGCFLSVWLFIEHEEGGTQGFGGWILGGSPLVVAGNHARQANLCAEWLVGIMRATELDDEADISKIVGRPVRVVREKGSGWGADILGIGHIIHGDRWFHAKEQIGALIKSREEVSYVRAAAPDMLEVLKLTLRMMREHGQTHDAVHLNEEDYLDCHDTGLSAPLSAVIEAAIAKAGGAA